VKNEKLKMQNGGSAQANGFDVAGAELSERLWDFAARVGKVVDALPDTRLGRHVAGQLVRSGTSAPPNYDEGCAGESRADFVHKLNIALKELRESRGWLRFIIKANLLKPSRVSALVDECEQLCRIIAQSIITAKVNANLAKRRDRSVPRRSQFS
jgi:four helix bundle protein